MPSVCDSRFYMINLDISFIYKDIFTKFAGNVYGYENICKNWPHFENKMATMADCVKIINML